MAAGFQVFDNTGRLTADYTWYISQTVGSVDTGGTNGSITLPALPAGKRYYYNIVPLVDTQEWRGKRPGVTVSGNILTWQYSFTAWFGQFAANSRIYYGFY